MNFAELCKLQSVRNAFIDDLKPKYIMPYLMEQSIVTEQEKKEILSLGSSKLQVVKLLDVLSHKNSEVIKKFKEVLKSEDEYGFNYPWLAEKLIKTTYNNLNEETKINIQDEVRKLLTDGGIPFQPKYLVPRESKIENVREKLCKASSEVQISYGNRHFVVIHGMTGTGKSVLAAEALKDNNLIAKYFPNGVFWISVGNLKDINALGLKMKKLFKLMNYEQKYDSTLENLHELTDELKKWVKAKDYKSLIILDDVWEHKRFNVIDYFDIGCPVLVTTKFTGIFDKYNGLCSFIPCNNDILIEEGKKLLALYVECESNVLPSEVDWIAKKCKGSPFTLSHIGRWMTPYGNDIKRWQSLKKKLNVGMQKAIRHRYNSGDELNEIKNVVYLTLEPIEDSTDCFLDFVIFPEDVGVPNQVFEVLWSKEEFDAQETLSNFVRTSLVQSEKDPLNVYSYSIHDLYLEILKEICGNIKERHQKLVNNYLKLCKTENGNYDFSLLPKDDYIHYYIGYHMQQAEDMRIIDDIGFDDIYFDLNFIEAKIRLDPRDLLVDYQNYRYLFKDKNLLDIFNAFASKVISKKNLMYNKEDCDIIQWGLFEPAYSIVYKKAFELATKSYNKSYFEWCNQEENQSHMTNLNSKLISFENLKCAAISADGQLVACVGNGNRIGIFSSTTGEELLELSGHSDIVNYCTFNSSCSKLATASDDKCVKIFQINIPINAFDMKPAKKRTSHPQLDFGSISPMSPDSSPANLILTFQEHFKRVLCCNFSTDETLIASSDYSGCCKVWQSSTGHLKFSINHNSENYQEEYPVKCCQFNFDGTLLGTLAYDSIRLWCTFKGILIREFSYNEITVDGFCFTANYVISVANNNIHKHCIRTYDQNTIPLQRNLIITSCSLTSDGKYLACGTSESTVIVYNINSGKKISNLKGHKKDILYVMYTEDSKKLLSVSEDGYVVHNIADIRDISHVSFEGNLCVQQTSEDIIIACSSSSNCIEIRKGICGELYCKSDPDDNDISACSLSPDCSEVLYGTKTGSLKVFNIQNKILHILPSHSAQINYITYYKNDLFFTCSEDKTIKIWKKTDDINVRENPTVLRGHTQSVLMCVPFKQCNKLVSCSKDGTLRVWDVNEGKVILFTEGHGNQDVRFCDVSFDEKFMASASSDHTVKIWYTENGTLYKTLECGSEVRCCRFSPLFQVLISGCDSGQVICWSLDSKIKCEKSYSHQSDVFNIYFSEDGSHYLSIADDIKIFKITENDHQTLILPSSFMGVVRPNIWVSDKFDIFVVVHDSVLYILRKIVIINNNSCH